MLVEWLNIRMKKLTLQICCCLILLFTAKLSEAQTRPISPLRKFLLQDADTTIVFQYTTNWLGPSAHYAYFISKKGKALTLYTYRDKKVRRSESLDTQNQIGARNEIMLVPEEVNKFFNAYPVEPHVTQAFWSALMEYHPWEIKDDKVEGEGCINKPDLNDNSVEDTNIYDGGGIQLSLITKDRIKVLDFYAPGFYEAQCPARVGRKAVLAIAELFEKYIK
jgi:hypothetical protein